MQLQWQGVSALWNVIMADDTTQRGGQDRTRISVEQDHEVRYWARELGTDEQTLKNAVRAVGPMVDKVREHLRGKGPLPPSGGSGATG